MRTLPLAVFLIAGAVNLQLPLYPRYAADAGLGSGAMSLLLAGYVGALLPCFILLGGASDRLGRKPLVLVALVASLLATLLVMALPGAWGLGLARWLQGVGVALGFGAATAWMTEIAGGDGAAGATSQSSAAGFGAGALVTGLWLGFVPSGTPATYGLWALLLVGAAFAVWRLPSPPVADPEAKLIRPPAYPRGSGLAAAMIGLGWGVAGIVVAVLPGVMHGLGLKGAGAVLFVMLGAGLVAQRHARTIPSRHALALGALLLPVGTGLLSLGVAWGSAPALWLGAAVAGTCTHGYGYLGGLARVTASAQPARAVSGYFLAAYVGFGMPAVLLGAAVDQWGPGAAFAGLAAVVTIGTVGVGVGVGMEARRSA